MEKLWMRVFLPAATILGSFLILFQNCGPAKLSGNIDGSSTATPNSPSSAYGAVGAKVDLASLLKAQVEPATNVLSPKSDLIHEVDYAQSTPIIENISLRANNFDHIQWIHGPTETVAAVGEAFNQSIFSSVFLGPYYVIGYRGQTPYLLAQYRFVDKGSTNLGVNSANAVTVTQKDIETVGTDERILIEVEGPSVEIASIKLVNKTTGQTIQGKRSFLITKQLAEAVSVDVVISDVAGQSLTRSLTLAAKQAPSPQPAPQPQPQPPAPAPQPQPQPPPPAPQPQPTGPQSQPVTTAENRNMIHQDPSGTINLSTGTTITVKVIVTNAVATTGNWWGFIHIVPANSVTPAINHDFDPNPATSTWNNGTITYTVTVPVGSGIANGSYTIRAGFFSQNSRMTMNVGPGVTHDGYVRYIIGNVNIQR